MSDEERIEWEGWIFEPRHGLLVEPFMAPLGKRPAWFFALLLTKHGGFVPLSVISTTVGPHPRSYAYELKKILGPRRSCLVVSMKGGYRLLPSWTMKPAIEVDPKASDAERAEIETLLVDELEATGPHARALAARIEGIYLGRKS